MPRRTASLAVPIRDYVRARRELATMAVERPSDWWDDVEIRAALRRAATVYERARTRLIQGSRRVYTQAGLSMLSDDSLVRAAETWPLYIEIERAIREAAEAEAAARRG